MDTYVHSEPESRINRPWNKGQLTGAKRLFARSTCGQ